MRNFLLFVAFIISFSFAFILAPIIAIVGLLLWFFSDSGETGTSTAKNSASWESYEDFLKSKEWEEKRKAVLDRASGECEMEDCTDQATEVHHLTYEHGWGNTPIHLLEALCGPCHDAKHPEKPTRYIKPSTDLSELLSRNDRGNSPTS